MLHEQKRGTVSGLHATPCRDLDSSTRVYKAGRSRRARSVRQCTASEKTTELCVAMTRLACASSVLLVVLGCLLHQAPTATCQLASPEVKKISILDLFQEEPSLKAELEARLQEKKKAPAEGKSAAPEPTEPAAPAPKPEEEAAPEQAPQPEEAAPEEPAPPAASEPTETASEDRRRRPSRLATRGRAAPAKEEPIADAAEPVETTEEEEPARRLRPHRLALRRNRPGLVAGGTTTTTQGPELPEPELEKGLEDELNAAEVPKEDGSTTTTASPPGGRKLRARFSLPPRSGAAATPSAPTERKEGSTASASGPASGLNRLRNARFGGGRTRNAGTAGDKEASPAAVDDTASDAPAKKPTRLSLAERRSRFSNARTPPSRANAAEETAADTAVDAAADAEDPEAAESQSPRRNARRFPTLARRNT